MSPIVQYAAISDAICPDAGKVVKIMYYRLEITTLDEANPTIVENIKSNEVQILKTADRIIKRYKQENVLVCRIRIERKLGLADAWNWFQTNSIDLAHKFLSATV